MKTVTVTNRALWLTVGGVTLGTLTVPGSYRIGDAVVATAVGRAAPTPDAKCTARAALIAGETDLIRAIEDAVNLLFSVAVAQGWIDQSQLPQQLVAKFAERARLRAILAAP